VKKHLFLDKKKWAFEIARILRSVKTN